MAKKLFDFAIGNPPYNDDFDKSGENGNYGTPVYHTFMDAADDVAEKVELIHPARFLFNAGSTPKVWNEKMLNDPHFKVLRYEENASSIFSNTDIKGGIAITYRDSSKEFGAIKAFTKYIEMNGVVRKVLPYLTNGCLSDIIFTQNRFNLGTLYEDHPEYKAVIGSNGKDRRFRNNIFKKITAFSSEKINEDDIPTFGLEGLKRVWKYIKKEYVDQSHENFKKWKSLCARANGSGQFGETLSNLLVLGPGEAYTQTFIGIGAFDNKIEADNSVKYLKTRFTRAMLGVLKVTQDNDREAWRMVPLQDFTPSSDIDWSKSVHEIDLQLYRKYGLSIEEINFIETHVKEMV